MYLRLHWTDDDDENTLHTAELSDTEATEEELLPYLAELSDYDDDEEYDDDDGTNHDGF